MTILHSAMHNRLLAALPATERDRLLPHLELVSMPLGEILYESGSQLQHVYFPTTAAVSLLHVLENGASAEIAVVGNEGALGISQLIVGKIRPRRAVVQRAGDGYRLKAQLLQYEFNRAGPVLRLLLQYSEVLAAQMTQTVACNRHHSIEQQLCRWLLLSLDRLSTDSLSMTQDVIANTLGVHREGLAEAAENLQHAGLIRYRRSHIKALDRAGLEKNACECYALIKRELDRLRSRISRGDPFHSPG